MTVTLPRGPDEGEEASVARSVPLPVSSSQPSVRVDAYIGQTLEGRYFVESLLGEGGMGFVYRGRHTVIDKRVAIKILRSDLAADQEMTERFMNEARAASSIGNPHIVDISDFGRLPTGEAFFVMEFLDGVSLGQLMDDRAVPIPRLVHISKQIARALSAAHQRGIVHRDLKPDNVMLVQRGDDRDFVKILDFGIAKVGGESGRLTRAGSVFGTPHYMSPEQAAGVPVDHRTDIYALGVILYEMSSGKVPFDADNFMGILTQHMYKAPAPIRALVPQAQEVPPGLEAIVLKALSKKVDLRYQTMDEVVLDLEKVEQGAVPNAVAEMMGRSGGFNVPADYFRNPSSRSGSAMVPAMPLQRRRRGVLLGAIIGAMLVIGAVATALVVVSMGSTVKATPVEHAQPSATPEPSAAPVVVPVVTVLVSTDPPEARVTNESQPGDQGSAAPRNVEVTPGKPVTLRVERQGYKTQRFEVDPAQAADPKYPKVVLKLEREPAPTPAANPRPTAPAGKAPATKPTPAPAPSPPPIATATPAPAQPCSPSVGMNGLPGDPWKTQPCK